MGTYHGTGEVSGSRYPGETSGYTTCNGMRGSRRSAGYRHRGTSGSRPFSYVTVADGVPSSETSLVGKSASFAVPFDYDIVDPCESLVWTNSNLSLGPPTTPQALTLGPRV